MQDVILLIVLGLIICAMAMGPSLVRDIRKNRYFTSEEFLAHKREIASIVAEHNAIANYASELRTHATFRLGASSTGAGSHLASFQNTSRHNYQRDRNVASYHAANVHNCSLQVVRNAKADPLKYVMKYFEIKPDENDLAEVESLGEDISRLEDAINNVKRREASITQSVNAPPFILKYYKGELLKHVGVKLGRITVLYPNYVFEYVSAGGNSSQRTNVELNIPTIDALIERLSQQINWRMSAAGQRALMTSKLRNFIKERDNHTCQYCTVSLTAEPHLLLEVDHIIPVSRGGTSTPDNLQTLCWRCNRTKSNKAASA